MSKPSFRDANIIMAVSGCDFDDLKSSHIRIEPDYLDRERDENLREQGELDIEEMSGLTVFERSFWRSEKLKEELEADRWQRGKDEESAHLAVPEIDEVYKRDRIREVVRK